MPVPAIISDALQLFVLLLRIAHHPAASLESTTQHHHPLEAAVHARLSNERDWEVLRDHMACSKETMWVQSISIEH